MKDAEPKRIVFLPGLSYKADIFNEVRRNLPEQRFTTYAFDLPPYGSKRNGISLNFDTYPDYLKEKLQDSDIGPPVILVGHSLGGAITLSYTAKNQNEVEGAVIISTPLGVPESQYPLIHRKLIALASNSERNAYAMQKLLRLKSLLPERFRQDADFLKNHNNLHSLALCYKDLLTFDFRPQIERISQEILLVYGTFDMALKGRTNWFDLFKKKRIVGYPAGHSVPLTHPSELAHEIMIYCDEQNAIARE